MVLSSLRPPSLPSPLRSLDPSARPLKLAGTARPARQPNVALPTACGQGDAGDVGGHPAEGCSSRPHDDRQTDAARERRTSRAKDARHRCAVACPPPSPVSTTSDWVAAHGSAGPRGSHRHDAPRHTRGACQPRRTPWARPGGGQARAPPPSPSVPRRRRNTSAAAGAPGGCRLWSARWVRGARRVPITDDVGGTGPSAVTARSPTGMPAARAVCGAGTYPRGPRRDRPAARRGTPRWACSLPAAAHPRRRRTLGGSPCQRREDALVPSRAACSRIVLHPSPHPMSPNG